MFWELKSLFRPKSHTEEEFISMPSFSDFFGRKKANPYTNQFHPGHNALPKSTPKNAPLANANNRDLLAEAREAAGRDPTTGQRRPDTHWYLPSERDDHGHLPSQRTSSTQSASLADLRQVEEEERTCFQSRAAKYKPTTGQRYDLYVQESLAKRDAESRARAARGGHEYYAPERSLEEFYSRGEQN